MEACQDFAAGSCVRGPLCHLEHQNADSLTRGNTVEPPSGTRSCSYVQLSRCRSGAECTNTHVTDEETPMGPDLRDRLSENVSNIVRNTI